MSSARRSIVPNPYARKLTKDLQHVTQPQPQPQPQPQNAHQIGIPATMGIQSQRRDGSIAAAKKRGAKRPPPIRRVQNTIYGGRAFVQHLDCKVCNAEHRGAKKPHRAHDSRCRLNTKTHGLSARTVAIEASAARNRKRNRTLYMPGDIPIFTPNERAMKHANYFIPRNATVTTTPTMATLKAAPKPMATTTPTIVAPKAVPQPTTSPCTASAASIRKELDLIVDADQCPKWATDASYPKEIGIVADKIIKACGHRKPIKTEQHPSEDTFQRAREVYLQFFQPGTCTFTFPPDFGATKPSPAYHSIAGDSILYLDWKLIDPTVNLHCPAC